MKNRVRFILCALVVMTAMHSVRGAETGVPSERVHEELPDTIRLKEVNVVALKQSSDLFNLPVSSTTLGQVEIKNNNIVDIKSISDIVPNFYMPDYGSRITSSIYVRGIGSRMDQPAVGLNIDNLPVMNKDAYDLDIQDIREIEMLRGPQSSLYGRNTMTGLINIRTLSPLSWQGVRLKAEWINLESYRLHGGWYHAFTRDMGLSASLSFSSMQGRFKNNYNNSDIDSEKSGSLRLKFEWRPSAVMSLLNTFSTSLSKQNGYPYEYVPTGEISYNDTCFYKRFLVNDALTMRFNFNGWSLASITSVQHINDNMTLDQDFLPLPYFTLTQKKRETSLTEEVIARRSGEHKYSWLGGMFAFYRHLHMDAPVNFGDTGIRELIENHRNDANPYYPIEWDSRKFALNSLFTIPTFGVALFHESRLNLGPWRLAAGLRMDYEKVRMSYNSRTNTSYTIYYNKTGNPATPVSDMEVFRKVPIDIDEEGRLTTDFLTLLPKISALYNFENGMGNIYATFGKGYKAGGFNTQMFSDVLQQKLMNMMGIGSKYDVEDIVKYKPEYSWNYEIGSHIEFASLSASQLANISLDVSLFYIDCLDQQLTTFPDGNTTGRIMTNAGKTRSFGGELAIKWNPCNPLLFNVSYGYTNAKFVKFNDGKGDYAGKRLPYAPSNTFFAQTLYTLSGNRLGENCVIFDVNVRGVGDIYWNEANTLRQNFYALLGAGVTFKAPKWEIQAWGRNLTDTRHSVFYFMSMGNEFLQRGEKISWGVTLRLFI